MSHETIPSRAEKDPLLNVRSHCVDFLQIEQNDSQFESLFERIKKSNGAIDVIVRPFFEKMVDPAEEDPMYESPKRRKFEYKEISKENYKRIGAIQENLFERVKSEEGNPCFVMEEQESRALLEEELKDGAGAEMNNTIYIVDTHNANPTPKISPPGQYWDEYKRGYELNEGWNRFIMLLRISGVKKVNVGGLYNDIAFHDLDVRERYSACVGSTMRFLRDAGFEIEISPYTYPLNGEEDEKLKKAFDAFKNKEMKKFGINSDLSKY